MITQIRAEFKKLFTVRSTYVLLGVMLVLLIFFTFYVSGWHSSPADLKNPHRLFEEAQQAISFLSIFTALIGLLLFTHEFRYNTVSYSLTLSNNRSRVLAAKVLAVSLLALTVTAIIAVLAPLVALLGIQANHLKLVHQSFDVGGMAWRGLIFGWGYAMAGLVIAVLIRNQIGSIVTLFIVPGTVEGILSIWLKGNTVYLPFSALHSMLGVGVGVAGTNITHFHAMLVFLGYLVVAWAIGWTLFLKRDAS